MFRSAVPVPPRIAKLPVDHRGYPVPYFVTWVNGVPDFRVITPQKIVQAVKHQHCWICGEKLGTYKAFVIGPMCAINRVSGEPPSHKECALFAAKVCPFLTRPKMKRNERDLPCGHNEGPGLMIKRNPGCSLVWITKKYSTFQADGGFLFNVGEPEETLWFAEGREATRAEVLESINSGFPILENEAKRDGPQAIKQLEKMVQDAMKFLPPEETAPDGLRQQTME